MRIRRKIGIFAASTGVVAAMALVPATAAYADPDNPRVDLSGQALCASGAVPDSLTIKIGTESRGLAPDQNGFYSTTFFDVATFGEAGKAFKSCAGTTTVFDFIEFRPAVQGSTSDHRNFFG